MIPGPKESSSIEIQFKGNGAVKIRSQFVLFGDNLYTQPSFNTPPTTSKDWRFLLIYIEKMKLLKSNENQAGKE